MMAYIKRRLPEFLLCVGAALGLNLAVLSGFELSGALATSPLMALEAVVLIVALLYLFAYNRLSTGIGVFVGAVLAAFTVFYMRLSDPLADEAANSLFIFCLVSVCVCLLVFLLTRTKTGSITVIAAGALVIGGAKFLDFPVPVWGLLLFLACSAGMVLMRVYGQSVRRAFTGFVRSWRYFAQVAGVVLISLLLSFVTFAGVIGPLDPPTKDLELISLLRSMDTMSVFGLSQTRQIYDANLLSSGALADQAKGNQQGEESGDQEEGSAEDASTDRADETQGGDDSANSSDWLENPDLLEFLQAFRFEQVEMWGLVVAIALVLTVAAGFAFKFWRRRSWHSRVGALGPRDAVINYYRFFMKRLAMAGFAKGETTTLSEYAQLTEHALQPFEAGGVTFARLTDIYLRAFYGGDVPAKQDVAAFETFYEPFYKNLRREMGFFRYGRKFFRM